MDVAGPLLLKQRPKQRQRRAGDVITGRLGGQCLGGRGQEFVVAGAAATRPACSRRRSATSVCSQ
jgi:hypothetical protein